MPNTKKLPAAKRKAAKRKGRKQLKALYDKLTPEQKTQLRKEKQGIKKFIAAQQAAAASAE